MEILTEFKDAFKRIVKKKSGKWDTYEEYDWS
jgi:hypothetical protein